MCIIHIDVFELVENHDHFISLKYRYNISMLFL